MSIEPARPQKLVFLSACKDHAVHKLCPFHVKLNRYLAHKSETVREYPREAGASYCYSAAASREATETGHPSTLRPNLPDPKPRKLLFCFQLLGWFAHPNQNLTERMASCPQSGTGVPDPAGTSCGVSAVGSPSRSPGSPFLHHFHHQGKEGLQGESLTEMHA